MAETIIYHKVRQLRSLGKTYTEINRVLKIPLSKSTLSNWCQGVILPHKYAARIENINRKSIIKAQIAAQASLKNKREAFLGKVKVDAEKIIGKLDLENLKMILAALYLGEGAKWRSHSGLMLGSSDSQLVLLYISLLKKCYKIRRSNLKCRISYRADQNINDIEEYWSTITGIPRENFYKTKPDPRTVGKKTKKTDYRGVCVVTCAGARIQLELEEIAKILSKKLRARGSMVEH